MSSDPRSSVPDQVPCQRRDILDGSWDSAGLDDCSCPVKRRRILICGSRFWDDYELIESVLEGLWSQLDRDPIKRMTLIEGGAKGADACAAKWAGGRGTTVEHLQFLADWPTHAEGWCPGEWCKRKSYCCRAGPRRNQQMIDEASPELVVAFKDGFNWLRAGGGGSEDMVDRAIQNQIPYYVIGRCG